MVVVKRTPNSSEAAEMTAMGRAGGDRGGVDMVRLVIDINPNVNDLYKELTNDTHYERDHAPKVGRRSDDQKMLKWQKSPVICETESLGLGT